MVLKQIITRNIQNHKEVVIDLPPTGFIVFMGDNSNGKSVIVRVTRDLLCNNIKKPQVRYDLVTNGAPYGEVIYVRADYVILTLHLTIEAASTYVSLQRPGEEPIIRYMADKSHMELVRAFGWNVTDDVGISINIAESDDALFFYKTPNKMNAKVLQSITTDARADMILEGLSNTLKESRNFKDTAMANVRVIQGALGKLEIQDTEALVSKKETLEYYYRNLSQIYLPDLPVIKPVPVVRVTSIYDPALPKVKYPRLYRISCNLPDITPLLQEMKTLRERKCPTCGRGFDCDC